MSPRAVSPRILSWALAAGLAGLALLLPRAPATEPTPLLFFGPFAELGAQVQWLRFRAASQRGEEARALELAESALALDPRAPEGWQHLAAHLAFDLASREHEPELGRRRAWFRAALSVLERGRARCAQPQELELFRAVLLLAKASGDPELDPGGAPALQDAARAALARSAALGQPEAADLLRHLEDDGADER